MMLMLQFADLKGRKQGGWKGILKGSAVLSPGLWQDQS